MWNGYHQPSPNQNVAVLNLNFRVFEVECPELEKEIKATRAGSACRLVLLGIEVVDKPKEPAIKVIERSYPVTPSPTIEEQRANALKLKEALAAKHAVSKKRGWFDWARAPRNAQPPLPLP